MQFYISCLFVFMYVCEFLQRLESYMELLQIGLVKENKFFVFVAQVFTFCINKKHADISAGYCYDHKNHY